MSTPAPPPPPRDLDELASAIVDGHLSTAEAAQARQDPLVAQRVEDMLAVRTALRATPPSPPGAMDAAVGAALGAYDFTRSARPQPTARRRSPNPAPWLAAAAAVVVFGLIAAGLVRRDSDESDTQTAHESADTTAAEDSADSDAPMSAGGSDDSGAPEDGAAGRSEDEFSTSELAVDLGAATNVDELRSLVEQSYTGGQAGAAPAPEAPEAATEPQTTTIPPCAGLSDAGHSAWGKVTFVATATYQGNPVRVHVYERPDGSTRLVATDLNCVDVVDVPFQGAP